MTIAKITSTITGMQLTFPHTTGTVFFGDINAAGKWVRDHGGELGRRINDPITGATVAREAVFQKSSKLPKWAKL